MLVLSLIARYWRVFERCRHGSCRHGADVVALTWARRLWTSGSSRASTSRTSGPRSYEKAGPKPSGIWSEQGPKPRDVWS